MFWGIINIIPCCKSEVVRLHLRKPVPILMSYWIYYVSYGLNYFILHVYTFIFFLMTITRKIQSQSQITFPHVNLIYFIVKKKKKRE